RGARVGGVLAQVRAELGPDAVILAEREGVVGGIGGFFAKKCVEVEAVPRLLLDEAAAAPVESRPVPLPSVPARLATGAYARVSTPAEVLDEPARALTFADLLAQA